MCSLSYFEVFHITLIFCKNTGDTLIAFCNKLEKEHNKGKNGFYVDCSFAGLDEVDYCSSIKTTKDNITRDNNTYNVNANTKNKCKSSSAIADKYRSMSELLRVINENKKI